jgi:hypothetical protein
MWWHTVTHGRGSEGRNCRMEWVASTPHTTSEHVVSSVTTVDAHTSAASSRMNWGPRRFKWTHPFPERRSLVSAHVPSYFKRIPLRYKQEGPGFYGPGVNSASNRNEYQEYLLGFVSHTKCLTALLHLSATLHFRSFKVFLIYFPKYPNKQNP